MAACVGVATPHAASTSSENARWMHDRARDSCGKLKMDGQDGGDGCWMQLHCTSNRDLKEKTDAWDEGRFLNHRWSIHRSGWSCSSFACSIVSGWVSLHRRHCICISACVCCCVHVHPYASMHMVVVVTTVCVSLPSLLRRLMFIPFHYSFSLHYIRWRKMCSLWIMICSSVSRSYY